MKKFLMIVLLMGAMLVPVGTVRAGGLLSGVADIIAASRGDFRVRRFGFRRGFVRRQALRRAALRRAALRRDFFRREALRRDFLRREALRQEFRLRGLHH